MADEVVQVSFSPVPRGPGGLGLGWYAKLVTGSQFQATCFARPLPGGGAVRQMAAMRARYARGVQATASAVMTWLVLKLEDIGLAVSQYAAGRRQRRYELRPVLPQPIARAAPVEAPSEGSAPPAPVEPATSPLSLESQEARAQNEGMVEGAGDAPADERRS